MANNPYINRVDVVRGNTTDTLINISDTTAAAADVAQGKYFYLATGERVQGTNQGGGGASNFVMGTFTADTGTGLPHTVTVPYTGSGYPIAAMVFVSAGAYVSGTTWYSSSQRYAVGQWTFSKANQSSAPTWATTGAENQGVTAWVYKNTSSSSYSRSSEMSTNVLSSATATGGATGAGAKCVRFQGNGKTLSYYTASTSYGLLAGETYKYIIVYSS